MLNPHEQVYLRHLKHATPLTNFLAVLPESMATKRARKGKKAAMSKERKIPHVRPDYVAESIRSRRLAAWHFSWQTGFLTCQMTVSLAVPAHGERYTISK